MAFHFYRDFLKNFLSAAWDGTGATSIATLSATPQVWVQGVTSGYVFDSTHTVEADFSAYNTEFVYELDGESATDCVFDDGVLYLADGTSVTTTADTAGIVLWVDHGTPVQLVGFWDNAFGLPLAASTTPTLEWSKQAHAVFEMLPVRGVGADEPMMYPVIAEEALGALIGGSARTTLPVSADLRCDFVDEDARFVWSHRVYSDIPSSWWCLASGEILASGASRYVENSGTDGARFMYDDDLTWTAAASTASAARSLVFWEESTSLLVGFCPLGTGTEVATVSFNDSDVVIEFTQTTGVITLRSA